MVRSLQVFLLVQCLQVFEAALVQAHVVITYPGWRGNNLGLTEDAPYGMQWMYPCGALSVTTNRTFWDIDGGALALQPGWFTGHETALMYINVGLGEQPENYSWPLTTFYLEGPTNDPYPGTVCLPKINMPEAVRSRVKNGDLATIQVVQAAKHGAGMFSCADIILTDDKSKIPAVDETNCFNSTAIKVSDVAILGSQQLPSACSSLGFTPTPGLAATTSAAGEGDMWGWACEDSGRRELFNGSLPANCTTSTQTAPTSTGENGAAGMRGKSGAMFGVGVMVLSVVALLVG